MAKENNKIIINEEEITTVLAKDIGFSGTLKFKTSLMIKGDFKGEIVAEGKLVIGPDANVKATITAKDIVSYGKTEGNITAIQSVILASSAKQTGDILTPNLIMESGSLFNGKAVMGESVKNNNLNQNNSNNNNHQHNQQQQNINKQHVQNKN